MEKGLAIHFKEKIEGVHNDFYLGISGKLYSEQAPEKAKRPYAVWSLPYGIPSYDLEQNSTDEWTAQIDIYADDKQTLLDLYAEAKALFDNCHFTLSAGFLIGFRRVAQRRVRQDRVYRMIIEYKIETEGV